MLATDCEPSITAGAAGAAEVLNTAEYDRTQEITNKIIAIRLT
jgi:hypothetical protein